MLINSAVRMYQVANSSGQAVVQLGLPPDNYQGFGRPQLSRVLPLGTAPSQPDLFVADSRPLATGKVHTYKFTVPASYVPRGNADTDLFEMTLTWTDPDSTAGAAIVVLHDLDVVASLDSALARKLFPNNRAGRDSVNNVEKIRIPHPVPGEVVTVNVTGTSITLLPTQEYALAVTGKFVAGAWYCLDPRVNRTDASRRTEYCRLPCGARIDKDPLCCATTAATALGSTCVAANAAPEACKGLPMPYDCVSPTAYPTKLPTQAPSNKPTAQPSSAPSMAPSHRPSAAPTRLPTRQPTGVPSRAPTRLPTSLPTKV